MPASKNSGRGLKKVLLLIFCVLLVFLVYNVHQAQKKLPVLLQSAIKDLNLEKKGVKLSFEKASFTFVSSLSHPFGLRVKGLTAQYKTKCEAHDLYVDRLILPVKVLPLYKSKRVDVGLIRLSGAKIFKSDSCGSQNIESEVLSKSPAKKKSKAELKTLGFFQKLKKINAVFLKQKDVAFKYKGILIYDLEAHISDQIKIYVDRFKALVGSGELRYKGEWESTLFLEDTKTSLKGEFTGRTESLEAALFFKEKESELRLELVSFYEPRTVDKLVVDVKSVPLSLLSKFKKTNFAGLNLRKTWLDSVLDLQITPQSLDLKVKKFKIYGDFGLIETDANSPHLLWKRGAWSLVDATQLKFHDINFFEILLERPQKKMAQVLKDVGSFNALVKLESLDKVTGDFETNDFSVSIRSMGRKAYQKIKSARGSLNYQKKESLNFNLEDVVLEGGDFEGLLKFSYDYQNKKITTDFDIQHLKFNPAVSEDLLGLSRDQDFFFKGGGFILKKNLTKPNKEEYQSDLRFVMGSPIVKTAHWTTENMLSDCHLQKKALDCELSIESLLLSETLSAKLALKNQKFVDLKSTSFLFENKILKSNLKSKQQNLKFDWTSKEGMGFSTSDSDKVLIRQL